MYWQKGSLYLLGKQVSAFLPSRQPACQAGSSLIGKQVADCLASRQPACQAGFKLLGKLACTRTR
jgi:hypothetical protein